jgi:hypothetical protein
MSAHIGTWSNMLRSRAWSRGSIVQTGNEGDCSGEPFLFHDDIRPRNRWVLNIIVRISRYSFGKTLVSCFELRKVLSL